MFCTEAVLFVSKYVVSVNVSHDVAMYDVFHDLRADGGQGYGSIVTRGGLVAFLIYGGDVRSQPVVRYKSGGDGFIKDEGERRCYFIGCESE